MDANNICEEWQKQLCPSCLKVGTVIPKLL